MSHTIPHHPSSPGTNPLTQSTSIILPAFNEEMALPTVVAGLRSEMPDAEIVVVDDASSDATAAVAKSLGCLVVAHQANLGKGAALRSGFAASQGDLIVFMDADATYPPNAIPAMIELLTEHEYVRANRSIDATNTPALNRIGNAMMERVLQTLHGLDPGDHLSGLYGFQRQAFEALETEARGFDIEVEIGIKVKEQALSVATIPIEYLPRIGEKKLQPLRDGTRILGRILRLVLIYRPMLLFGLPGALLTAISLGAAVLLAGGPIVTGYLGLSIHTFVVSALGVLAGFQLLFLGVSGAVYRRQLGFAISPVVSTLTSPRARMLMATVGTLLVLFCGVWFAVIVIGWVAAGGPVFTQTRLLVATATGSVFGLQLLSGSLFITMLSDRIRP